MRILHIDTELTWRGGENQLRLLLAGLARSDAESFVAVRPGSAAAGRLKGVAPLWEVPMRGGFDPGAARALAKACREHRIDLIDAHTSNAHTLALLTRLMNRKVRLVVHRRVDYVPKSGAVNRWKYMTPQVDRFVAISSAIKGVLTGYGVPATRVNVVKSAVDPAPYARLDRAAEKAALAKAYGIDPQLPFLGNASALSAQKDYPTLIEAARLLKAQGARFHLFIAGDGDERDALERQRIAAGLEHDVTFLGFIEDVPRFLAGLDIFALSSDYEGLGTILLEAAHAGLCLVATAVGGVPEIVRDGATGLLAPAHSPLALAKQLARVIGDADARNSLAEAARAHVRAEFSLPAMVGGNLEVYRDVLTRP
jgi:glycosyltransferase involved in cell wall biosynthesis